MYQQFLIHIVPDEVCEDQRGCRCCTEVLPGLAGIRSFCFICEVACCLSVCEKPGYFQVNMRGANHQTACLLSIPCYKIFTMVAMPFTIEAQGYYVYLMCKRPCSILMRSPLCSNQESSFLQTPLTLADFPVYSIAMYSKGTLQIATVFISSITGSSNVTGSSYVAMP